jgi:phosphopantetheinyl transferase
MEKVKLYVLHSSLVKENYNLIYSFVSELRRKKADKFINEKDKLLSLGAAYLIKKYLPSEDIKEMANGKLFLPDGPFFNISHSEELIVLAVHESRDVGVDIEKIDDRHIGAIKYVLNDEERNIDDTEKLFMMWSNKESLVKCVSTGLLDIKKVNALPLVGCRELSCNSYYSISKIYNGYSLSITLKGKEPFEVEELVISDLKRPL